MLLPETCSDDIGSCGYDISFCSDNAYTHSDNCSTRGEDVASHDDDAATLHSHDNDWEDDDDTFSIASVLWAVMDTYWLTDTMNFFFDMSSTVSRSLNWKPFWAAHS